MVLTNGFPEPASAWPIASTARRSAATAPAKSPLTRARSCLNARWMTPSAAPRGLLQGVEVVEVAAPHLGPCRGDLLGRGVGAREADDFVPRGQEIADDGETDVTGRAGDEDTHENLLMSATDIAVPCDVSLCNHVG